MKGVGGSGAEVAGGGSAACEGASEGLGRQKRDRLRDGDVSARDEADVRDLVASMQGAFAEADAFLATMPR